MYMYIYIYHLTSENLENKPEISASHRRDLNFVNANLLCIKPTKCTTTSPMLSFKWETFSELNSK